MAARRRNFIAPFEVMGTRGGGAAGGPPPEPGPRASGWPPTDPDSDTVDMEPQDQASPGGRFMVWRSRSAAPILVRVPRAYAVMFVLMGVAVVAMAYWVGDYHGYKRGDEAGYRRRSAEIEQQQGFATRFMQSSGAASTSTEAAAAGENGGDPRQVGLNYYIICRYPLAEPEAAQQFLARHGVETFLLHDDNAPLYYEVIALRGFARIGPEAQAFKNELDRLGRIWKRSPYDGPDDFDPYARKHER
jgi:hypothetical protein